MTNTILLRCDKCGNIREPKKAYCVDLFDPSQPGLALAVEQEPCPTCNPPEISYGPLTVEMVAEAVVATADAWYRDGPHNDGRPWWAMQQSLARAQARFVLRLLKALDKAKDAYEEVPTQDYEGVRYDWHARILNLAKDA